MQCIAHPSTIGPPHPVHGCHRGVPQASDAGHPLCQRSYLGHVLPESLLYILETYGAHAFATTLAGDSSTPEVIWSHSMRTKQLLPQVSHPQNAGSAQLVYTTKRGPFPKGKLCCQGGGPVRYTLLKCSRRSSVLVHGPSSIRAQVGCPVCSKITPSSPFATHNSTPHIIALQPH